MSVLKYDVTYQGQQKSTIDTVISIETSEARAMVYMNDHSLAEHVIREFVRDHYSSPHLLKCEAREV